MSTDSIHDLLEVISSGQPVLHRVSVDDLVRAGRRRRRGAAAGVAGGTAAVIAVAGVAVSAGSGRSQPGLLAATSATVAPGAAVSAGPTAVASVPALPSPVTTTVTPPAVPSSAASAAPEGGHRVPISNLSVLNQRTKVWTQVYAHHCVSFPRLTVQETETEVRLSLYLTMPPHAASVAAHDEYPLCSSTEVPTDPNGGGYPLYDGSASISLSSPIGTRRVVDEATGKTIPYADQAKALVPTWLPAGFRRVGTIDPEGPNGWSQVWQIPHPKSAIVWQEITFNDTGTDTSRSSLSTVNASVNGHAAWLDHPNKSEVDLQWIVNGEWYDLQESSTTDGCPGMMTIPPDAECNQGAKVTAVVTPADLIRMAESFTVPEA